MSKRSDFVQLPSEAPFLMRTGDRWSAWDGSRWCPVGGAFIPDAAPVMPLPRCLRCERMRGPVIALAVTLIVSICISAVCLAFIANPKNATSPVALPSSRRGAAEAPPVVTAIAAGGADFSNGGIP